MSTRDLIPTTDLPFLAREINDAHQQINSHAKGMLLEAKRAGEALLAAKEECPHGSFEDWVRVNTQVAPRTAQKYMKVAQLARKSADLGAFDGGVDAFLQAHAKPRLAPPQTTPALTEDDAEHVLKIHALATQGTGGEREVAASKLEKLAQRRGTTPETLVAQAEVVVSDRGRPVTGAALDQEVACQEGEAGAERHLGDPEESRTRLFKRREQIIESLLDHTREELIELLAEAYLQIEGAGANFSFCLSAPGDGLECVEGG